MQKRLLLLFFLILLVESVYGEYKELIYNNWLYSNENFTVENKRFVVGIDTLSSSVSIEFDAHGFIINNHNCKDIINLSICFQGLNVSYRNYTSHQDVYKANIIVYSLLAKIELKRTIESPELSIGERTNIDIIIKNIGSIEANNIEYIDEFKDFNIVDTSGASGCRIRDNSVVWTGSLAVDMEARCSYTIEANREISYSSNASLTYFNGKKTLTLTEPTKIKVSDYPFKILFNISKDRLEVGELFNISIKLKNNHSSKYIDVNFYLEIPDGLLVLNQKGLTEEVNKYTWSGYLESKEEKNFLFLLRGKYTKDYYIKAVGNFEMDGSTKTVNKIKKIEIYINNLNILFKTTNKTIAPLERTNIKAYVINPNQEIIKDVSINIKSDISSINKKAINIGDIKSKSNYRFIDTDFIAPNISHEYFVSVNASYKTIFEQGIFSHGIEHIKIFLPWQINQTETNISQNQTQDVTEEQEVTEVAQEGVISAQYSLPNKSEEGLEGGIGVIRFSPYPKLKEIYSRFRGSYSKILFVLFDIVLGSLIVLIIIKIRREK